MNMSHINIEATPEILNDVSRPWLAREDPRRRRYGVTATEENALVSVVIPVYNGERYLGDAIESVLAQTYRPVQLLVVDDGSTDKSADVAKSYAEVLYIHQTNQGHGVAKNVGAAAANGEFLAFLDSDDLWAPDKLDLQVGHLQRNPDVGYVSCHMRNFLEPGQSVPPWLAGVGLSDVPAYIPSALLVRRSVFDEVGGFDPSYRRANDVDWHLRAKDAGVRMGSVDRVLLRRRIHDANLSHDRTLDSPACSELFRAIRASIERKRRLDDRGASKADDRAD